MEEVDKQKEWLNTLLSLSKEDLVELSNLEISNIKKTLIDFINSNLDVLIVKGAAGTGKTKSIEILNNLKDQYGVNIKIFTPTFAAATNIRSRNLGEVQTIQWFFSKSQDKQLQLLESIDILIFDEASMLTSDYLEDLLNLRKTINKKFKYLFLGDSAQIRPYDGYTEFQEKESFALLKESFSNLNCKTIELNTPWRFITEPKTSLEFLSFLYFLRNKDFIDELPKYLPRCPEIDYVKEKNEFLNLLQVTPSVLDFITKYIDNGFNVIEIHKAMKTQYPSIIKDIQYEQFEQTIQTLKDKNNRSAEIGKIYKDLINDNKNNTTLIVRGNQQAQILTNAIRRSLYDSDKINKINKNDLLRINSTGSNVFFKGDVVRICNVPVKQDFKQLKINNVFLHTKKISNELNDYFASLYSIKVERVMIGQSKNYKIEKENISVNTVSLDKIEYQDYKDWTNLIRREIDDLVNNVANFNQEFALPSHLIHYRNLTLEDLQKFKEIDNRFKERYGFRNSSNVIPVSYEHNLDANIRLAMWEEMEKLISNRRYTMSEMISPTLQPEVFQELEYYFRRNYNQESEANKTLETKLSIINQLSSVDIVYGYSMTGYRSQGGEWENIIIQDSDIWNDPRFLYTAMSRAKDKVFFSSYDIKD